MMFGQPGAMAANTARDMGQFANPMVGQPPQAPNITGQTPPAGVTETRIFDKTRLCKFYARGKCRRGQACTFAHGQRELVPQPDFYKTQLCIDFFRTGGCPAGGECRFAHSTEEIRRSRVPRTGRAAQPGRGPGQAPQQQQHQQQQQQQRQRRNPAQRQGQQRAPRDMQQLPPPSLPVQSLAAQIYRLEAEMRGLRARAHLGVDDMDLQSAISVSVARQPTHVGPIGADDSKTSESGSWCDEYEQEDGKSDGGADMQEAGAVNSPQQGQQTYMGSAFYGAARSPPPMMIPEAGMPYAWAQ